MPFLAHELTAAGLFAQGSPVRSSRICVGLNGLWERHVNQVLYDIISVPSSQRPLGFYELKRSVALPRPTAAQRAILHFDAVNYFSRAFVNDTEAGIMGPYVPCEFDITQLLRDGENAVAVRIADLRAEAGGQGKDEIEFGLSPGWEAYSGIIRDVYIEYRPSTFIDNVRFGYTLSPDYSKASCRAQLYLDSAGPSAGKAEISLLRGGAVVAHSTREVRLTAGLNQTELEVEVDAPVLWSPETPNLYTLAARINTAAGEDVFSCHTGFRDVRIHGRDFELNGSRLVLNGVCRHDMWKDQGFTLTLDQMRQDMQMIKMMGANFVRLVHYPHHRRIVELANELGLLVTEEPGHWNVDFHKIPRGRIDVSLRVLEGAIRRDWNSPAVFAWLAGNECTVTAEYLREAKALCNRLDPISRPVSFAHIYNDSKNTFDAGGLDFYTRHMYDFDDKKFAKAPEYFGAGKPLVHTEWGWEDPGHGQIVYERSFDRLLDVVDAGLVAGHSFWSWQDVRQYTRVDWPTRNGILLSGVVEESREPRERLYMDLRRLFQLRRHEVTAPDAAPERVPLRTPPWAPGARLQPIPLQEMADTRAAQNAWAELESRMAQYWSSSWITKDQWERAGHKMKLWRPAELLIAGAAFQVPVNGGFARPLVLTPESAEIVIPVGLKCARLHVLGHVTMPTGFPLQGRAGETVATYTIHYASGARQQIPIRNGIEVARANLIHEATRVEPVASASPRALVFAKDPVRERYQILLFSIPLSGAAVDRVQVTLSPGQQPLLLFAMNAETA
jgi:Glycosyl hydrolases family 2, TIM barrel domain/Glycosyl hydrolases family 2, sugar binding domain/Glycosyl hydrolases family 2